MGRKVAHLARSSLSLTVDEKRKGLRAVWASLVCVHCTLEAAEAAEAELVTQRRVTILSRPRCSHYARAPAVSIPSYEAATKALLKRKILQPSTPKFKKYIRPKGVLFGVPNELR